jgi:hypothetical protein
MAAAIIQNDLCRSRHAFACISQLLTDRTIITKEGERYDANKDCGKHTGFGHCPEMLCVSWNGKGLGRERGHVSSLRRLWQGTDWRQ